MTQFELDERQTAPSASAGGAVATAPPKRRRRYSLLNRRDKTLLAIMVGIPLILDLILIWGTTFVSFLLSFTDWQGQDFPRFVGLLNYNFIFFQSQDFWPAVLHNLYWLLSFVLIATPMGMFLAVLLDRQLRGSWIYQTVFFIPVVLSLAVVGIIWQLQYSPLDGFINSALVSTNIQTPNSTIDWLGDPGINIWAAIVAAMWRHVGYIMVLYLAGLKSVDPSLRESAAIDGANERQTFFHVVFPVMAPINVVILVVTVIESLRAFDIVYIINHGKNGLELLSTLVTNNALSEASLIGRGSAIAIVLLLIALVPIVTYLTRVMRQEAQ
jgi:ABC-type sugar transport system permease subunit